MTSLQGSVTSSNVADNTVACAMHCINDDNCTSVNVRTAGARTQCDVVTSSNNYDTSLWTQMEGHEMIGEK